MGEQPRADEPDVVVSYWHGRLPEITALHFRSFLNHSRRTSYVLYLDVEAKAPIPEYLRAVLDHPRIEVRDVSLADLAREVAVPPLVRPYPAPFGNVFRLVRGGISQAIYRRIPVVSDLVKGLVRTLRLGVVEDRLAWFESYHHLRFLANPRDLAYRADVFRCLIPSQHPGRSLLYLDLDTVVMRDLSLMDWSTSFTYRWAQAPFANTAILFHARHEVEETHRRILERLRVAPNAKPWAIFTDDSCATFGLEILDAERFDPPWDPASLWSGRPRQFFVDSPQAEAIVLEAHERYPILHWHNSWDAVPEPGSPFARLLKQVS